jgi:DNA mismatch repair protein MSH3
VILDELGRGTSTHDGVAIAYATLKHIVLHIRCTTLFVTHYPILTSLERDDDGAGGSSDSLRGLVRNGHMSYIENCSEESKEGSSGSSSESENYTVTFLYKLVEGMANRSFGLNVAKLAGLPPQVRLQTYLFCNYSCVPAASFQPLILVASFLSPHYCRLILGLFCHS